LEAECTSRSPHDDRPPGKPVPYPPLIYAGKDQPELSEAKGSIISIIYFQFEEYCPRLIEVSLA